MRRIPFDRGAKMLSIPQAGGLLGQAGLEPESARSFFYFPRLLAFLRFLEPALSRLPLGAQYLVLARKP